jgi:hypothetical protein
LLLTSPELVQPSSISYTPRWKPRGLVATKAVHAQAIGARATGTSGEAEGGQRNRRRKHRRCRCIHAAVGRRSVFRARRHRLQQRALDGPSSAAGSTPAITGPMVHVCGHCQKRFRSPGKTKGSTPPTTPPFIARSVPSSSDRRVRQPSTNGPTPARSHMLA